MGITVDPSFIHPQPVDAVTGPDGILSAKIDPANASVLLWADYTTSDPTPQRVRFCRGDGTPVRSGDPAWAPGGIAIAYDHEAPIGTAAPYYAVPVYRDGTLGDPSATVTVQLSAAAPDQHHRTWLKAVGNPAASRQVRVHSFTHRNRHVGANITRVQGSRLPIATRDVLGSLEADTVVRTDTKTEYDDMLALLDELVLLFQPPAEAGEDDAYVMVTSSDGAARLGGHSLGWAMRLWTLQLTECDRPATLDAPLRIPGNSYAETDPDFPTYAEAVATGVTYAEESGIELESSP